MDVLWDIQSLWQLNNNGMTLDDFSDHLMNCFDSARSADPLDNTPVVSLTLTRLWRPTLALESFHNTQTSVILCYQP